MIGRLGVGFVVAVSNKTKVIEGLRVEGEEEEG